MVSVNIEGNPEPRILRILRQIPGVVVLKGDRKASPRADVVIHFAGSSAPALLEFKPRANAATAWELATRSANKEKTWLIVVAGTTTAEARSILTQHGIGYLDGAGHVDVRLPGLFVHLEPPRAQASRPAPRQPTRLTGRAGVAVQALLLAHGRDWRVKDLAVEAGVSMGLAHRVLARLDEEGLVSASGQGPQRVRRVSNAGALLDLFAEEDAPRALRQSGYILAQSIAQLVSILGAAMTAADVDHAFTGAAAADRLAPFATSITVVDVWVSSGASPESILRDAGGEPVRDGANARILQALSDVPLAFRRLEQGVWLANPIRVYADLRRDPRRGRELADHFRREALRY